MPNFLKKSLEIGHDAAYSKVGPILANLLTYILNLKIGRHLWMSLADGLQTIDNIDFIQRGPTKTAPLLINTIEMRVLLMEIKYIKSASRVLNRA